MEHPPTTIVDWLDVVTAGTKGWMRSNFIADKTAKRFLLQRLRAHELLAAWLDVSSLEQVDQILHRIIDLPVPQQWIGSSLALAMECGKLCTDPRVSVKVFDWGRSELCSTGDHEASNQEQKQIRMRYFRQYVLAVCRFYWELCRVAAYRCCSKAWSAFVFEVRVQPLSVVRAALVGGERSAVLGMRYLFVPSTGLVADGEGITLQLMAASCQVAAGAQKPVLGVLHVRISTPEGVLGGEGSVIIQVQGATQLQSGLNTSGTSMTLVRVIGFERSEDAEAHFEAWDMGRPEPVPEGRAYSQTTAPGKVS